MRTRLLLGFLIFTVLITLALELPLGISLEHNDRNSATSALERDATSLSLFLGDALERHDVAAARSLVNTYAKANGVGVLVVSGTTSLFSSSAKLLEELQDSGISSIMQTAAHGGVAGFEPAGDGDDEQIYAAVPVDAGLPSAVPSAHDTAPSSGTAGGSADGRTAGGLVLLLTAPAGPLNGLVRDHWLELLGFGLAVVAVAGVLGFVLARSLVRPLRGIEAAVAEIGAGRLEVRAPHDRGPRELRDFADAVNTMAVRLGELVSAQRAFVADASHQLRTPLTALRLRLDAAIAASGGETNLSKAVAEVERLNRLVEGLLVLARAEESTDEKVAVDVGEVVRDRLTMWEPLAEERGVNLHDSNGGSEGQHLVAMAGRGHLEQVLDNLLDNAIEATPPGKSVVVSASESGQWVGVRVIDEGVGMSAIDRRRAFDRFWRGSSSDRVGSGLGLAIVDQLVRSSGGSVELLESAGGGVEALVKLRAGEASLAGDSRAD